MTGLCARAAALTAVVVAVGALTGCGAPTRTPAQAITAVPYHLAAPSAPASPASVTAASQGRQVWFVSGDHLVPVPGPDAAGSTRATAQAALARLVAGPSEAERAEGLSTALGPDALLTIAAAGEGRAVVAVQPGEQAPSPGRLPLAVGQVVLTLASIDGIRDVVLTADGSPVEAPLPGGALTAGPLRAADYLSLVLGRETTPGPAPSSPVSSLTP